MASHSINLLRSKQRADGKMQIIIKISAAQSSDIIRTGIFVWDTEWDTKKRTVLGQNARLYNRSLDVLNGRIQAIFNSLFAEGKLKTATAKEIRQIFEADGNSGTSSRKKATNKMAGDKNAYFFEFTNDELGRINKKKTLEAYTSTVKKVRQFYESENPVDSSLEMTFNDVDVAFVKRFEAHMEKEGLAVNSRSLHLRNLRKLYNDAIDDNKASLEAYPFRRFKIKSEETPHRNMEIKEFIALRDYTCEPHQQQYIDMFFLGFYLIGINMIDLCNLKEIKDGRIEFRREKTGRLYSIKVEPEALAIINKYKGENYLLSILERTCSHKDYLHRLNENLKQVGETKIEKHGKKVRTPLFSSISWYYARHTWATIASKLDVPKDTISAALGHGETTTTDIYIDFDQTKIDEANRRVIDYVNGYKKM
jgi:site-specific recombinase XerD